VHGAAAVQDTDITMSHSSVFGTYSEGWIGIIQFEGLTAVLLTIQGVWNVTLCSADVSNDICLHLQRLKPPVTLRHIPRDLDHQPQFSATCHEAVARQHVHSAPLHSILDSAITGSGFPPSLVFAEASSDFVRRVQPSTATTQLNFLPK
jgi:hypothetical protein